MNNFKRFLLALVTVFCVEFGQLHCFETLPGDGEGASSVATRAADNWKEISLSDWSSRQLLSYEDLKNIMNNTITLMSSWLMNEQSNWVKDYDKIKIEMEDILSETSESFRGSKDELLGKCGRGLYYATKAILPANAEIIIMGDVHAKYETIDSILKQMKRDGLMDEQLKLSENVYFFGLGDYVDRGGESWKTLATLLLLLQKNGPDRVFLIRGNHENVKYKYGSLFEETKHTVTDDEHECMSLILTLSNTYEFFPSVVYLGRVQGGCDSLKVLLLSHGGVEVRYNYRNLLDFDHEELINNGGVRFDPITIMGLDLLKEEFIDELIEDIHVCDTDYFSDYYENPSAAHGFCQNDLNIRKNQQTGIQDSDRKKKSATSPSGILKMTASALKRFLNKTSSDKYEIIGLVNGHGHNTAKRVLIDDPGAHRDTLSEVQAMRSPSVVISDEQGSALLCKDPENFRDTHNVKFLKSSKINEFTATTIMSGPIVQESNIINYCPTFLKVTSGDDGGWILSSTECE